MSSPAHAAAERIVDALECTNQYDEATITTLRKALRTITGPNPAHQKTNPRFPIDNQSLTYFFRTDTVPHHYRLTVKDADDGDRVVFNERANFADFNNLSFAVPASYDDENGVTHKTFTAGHEYYFTIRGVLWDGTTETPVGQAQLTTKRAVANNALGTGLLLVLELIDQSHAGHV